jgi:multidrug transporter EmrE-like cation transporter
VRPAELALLLVGVLLNAAAQLLLKTATRTIGPVALELNEVGPFARALALAPACWAAVALYGLSIIVWAASLSRVPVSQAYPLLSLGYAIMLVAGWWLLGEVPPLMRVVGIGVIIAGVALVAAS